MGAPKLQDLMDFSSTAIGGRRALELPGGRERALGLRKAAHGRSLAGQRGLERGKRLQLRFSSCS